MVVSRLNGEFAGLARLETDSVTGERLDERLLSEADRPDMRPLVQLASSRRWEARATKGAETVLPLAAFEKLGGVKGIVQDAGETALTKLGEPRSAIMTREPAIVRRYAKHSSELAPTGVPHCGRMS